MARTQTAFGGMTTTPVYDDGDCYSLVNLRKKNASMEPVSPRKIKEELSQTYDIVFVHKGGDYENWVGVRNEDGWFYIYWDIKDEAKLMAGENGTVNSVKQFGNTLSFITNDSVYYAIYKSSMYSFLGEIPDIPPIVFKGEGGGKIEAYFTNEYGDYTINKTNIIESTKGLVNKAMDKVQNGWIDKDGNEETGSGALLFDAHFLRYAFRMYDGSLIKHSAPILLIPNKEIIGKGDRTDGITIKQIFLKYSGDNVDSDSYVEISGYSVFVEYNFLSEELMKWKDIIKSVDIFLSLPLGVSSIENIRNDLISKEFTSVIPNKTVPLIIEMSSDAIKNLKETSNFYFFRSIALGESGLNIPIPNSANKDEMVILKNMANQELMIEESASNHKIGASSGYAYNNRIHLGGVTTTFFKGFNGAFFQWSGEYNGVDPDVGKVGSLCIEVELATEKGNEKVYSFYGSYLSTPKLFFSSFFSYPDPRAIRMTVYEITSNVWTKVFQKNLTPHKFLSLSYYLKDDLDPIKGETSITVSAPQNTDSPVSLYEESKLKVSALNNPFYFPNVNTYQIGNERIMALASNVMNVSDRNYGQWPLYVFTRQGVWTLGVGSGEVAYSTQQAPSFSEGAISPVICPTPYGVVFVTRRGLMIINGQSVDFLSPQLEESPIYYEMNMHPQTEGVVFQFPKRSFKEYLTGLEAMIWNHFESELIIVDKDSEYNYVFGFDTRSFFQTTERIGTVVENVYPDLYVLEGNKVKDFSAAETPDAHVSLITRPMSFGTPDIKRLERMIMRGIMYDVKNPLPDKPSVIMVRHSNDGVNFFPTRGLKINPKSYRDFDMGMFARSKYRQFMFSFAGVMDEKSRLYLLDTEVEKEYNNTKMR